MGIAIRSGAATVVASGTVTAFGGQPLTFDLGSPSSLCVELEFVSDPKTPEPAVVTEAIAEGFRLVLTNFDGTDGRGSARPVLLGEDGEDLLFFHFRVMRFGLTEDRTVFYSFYRVGKEAVGWQPLVGEEDSG